MGSAEESPLILVVDDDREVRYSLARVLSSGGYRVIEAESGEEGIKAAQAAEPGMIFLDVRMRGMSGIEALQRLRQVVPRSMIVLMTAYGTTQTAIEAMKFGAFDYVVKPFDINKVISLARSAYQAREDLLQTESKPPPISSDECEEEIVGRSEAMQRVFKIIGQVAQSEVTVLITGESGTGKELVARAIHRHSRRSRGPLETVNCAAIPDNLIESELFGHERGAFTGAIARRTGRFEQCDSGTIFLDEIGDMALPTQTKILRVLQEGEIQRLGGNATVKVNVRVLAATNRDIERMVVDKMFREDLYYRLNVVQIHLPPLRDRLEDVPMLAYFILQKLRKGGKTQSRNISPDAMSLLLRHRWPGNVRELENILYRSAILAKSDAILSRDLPPEIRALAEGKADKNIAQSSVAAALPTLDTGKPRTGALEKPSHESLPWIIPIGDRQAEDMPANRKVVFDQVYSLLRGERGENLLSAVEKELIARALRETNGSQARAAGILGMTRTTLRKRIAQFATENKSTND